MARRIVSRQGFQRRSRVVRSANDDERSLWRSNDFEGRYRRDCTGGAGGSTSECDAGRPNADRRHERRHACANARGAAAERSRRVPTAPAGETASAPTRSAAAWGVPGRAAPAVFGHAPAAAPWTGWQPMGWWLASATAAPGLRRTAAAAWWLGLGTAIGLLVGRRRCGRRRCRAGLPRRRCGQRAGTASAGPEPLLVLHRSKPDAGILGFLPLLTGN
jgi:hypothetical protein